LNGRERPAKPKIVKKILAALGVSLSPPCTVAVAIRERKSEMGSRLLPPVIVAWDGQIETVLLSLLPGESAGSIRLVLKNDETGEGVPHHLSIKNGALGSDEKIPFGYYTLTLSTEQRSVSAFVISAPQRAYELPANEKRWGVFVPMYALHSRTTRGVGDLKDLETLFEMAGRAGAGFVGTLPLMSSFHDDPCEASPYMPVSRLFWNELFLPMPELPAEKLSRLIDYRESYRPKKEELIRRLEILKKEDMGPKRQIVILNAAAAIVVAGKARDIRTGLAAAAESIDSGAANNKLEALIQFLSKQKN
jgi:4-alpha-glucanotransferase